MDGDNSRHVTFSCMKTLKIDSIEDCLLIQDQHEDTKSVVVLNSPWEYSSYRPSLTFTLISDRGDIFSLKGPIRTGETRRPPYETNYISGTFITHNQLTLVM